jgi:hypothetical protein
MQEKYGFVYIWRDRKHKRFYIGAHWGTTEDGYVCSSDWMKQAYKIRNIDFKRRILSTNLTREMLFDIEFKWLQLIKDEELGKKYYNLKNTKWEHWSQNKDTAKTVGQKISDSPLRKQRIGAANRGKQRSIEQKEHLRSINIGKTHSEETKQRIKNLWKDPAYIEKQRITRSDPSFYDNFRNRDMTITEETRAKMIKAHSGKKLSEETKEKMRLSHLGKKYKNTSKFKK